MDLTNLSWHLGAFVFAMWAIWIVLDLKHVQLELSESFLPLLLSEDVSADSFDARQRSQFVRAAQFIIERELQPHFRAKLKFSPFVKNAAHLIVQEKRSAAHLRRALGQIFSLKFVSLSRLKSAGSLSQIAQQTCFLCNGINLSLAELGSLLSAPGAAKETFVFRFIVDATSDSGLLWQVDRILKDKGNQE